MSLDDGMTAYIFGVAITNNSPKTLIVIHGFDLKPPWRETELDWLEDPGKSVPGSGGYRYPGTELRFPRQDVLNQRRYDQGKLGPGDTIRGLLLGRGTGAIPQRMPHGSIQRMPFTVIDSAGKRHSAPVRLRIDVLRRTMATRRALRRRGGGLERESGQGA